MDYQGFKTVLLDFLKGSAIKVALRKVLGSAALGGFKAWLIKFLITELFDEIAKPMILYSLRKGMLFYDKQLGKIKVKKIIKAKEEGDESSYDENIDDI